jgi:dynein heavy chain, axonemal
MNGHLQIRLSLSNPEILVSPTIPDIAKILSKLWRNMVESTKLFIRWMDGTCIETPEQHIAGEDEEVFSFNFYNDVQMNPLIIKAILNLDNRIRKGVNSIKQCESCAVAMLFDPISLPAYHSLS